MTLDTRNAWQAIWRVSGAVLAGTAIGMAFCLLLAMTARSTLSHKRLNQVVLKAFASGDLDFNAHRDEDYFTECAMLIMEFERVEGAFHNAIETRLDSFQDAHPCVNLESLATTGLLADKRIPASLAYPSYPFGSRFLNALVLSVFDLRTTRQLYSVLSYGSVLLLCAMGFIRLPRARWALILSLASYLLLAFSLHRFGHNLSHAPGYFVGFLGLTVFVLLSPHLRSVSRRVLFICVLATIVAFFDLLHGSIPVVLSLAIVLNHFLFREADCRDAETLGRAWRNAIAQASAVTACFLCCYVVLTVTRLILLSAYVADVWPRYSMALALRLSDKGPEGALTVSDVISRLWPARIQLSPGGLVPASWLIFFALASWVGLVPLAAVSLRGRSPETALGRLDAFVLVCAGIGVLAWYALFLEHSYIHVLFMVRLVAVPAAYGVAAAAILAGAIRAEESKWQSRAAAVSLLGSAAVATLLLKGAETTLSSARFVDEPATDLVACAPLGLRGDGKTDGLIEIVLATRETSPLLALFGFEPNVAGRKLPLGLERTDPPGWWASGPLYPLGVSVDPQGPLTNNADASVPLPTGKVRRVWGHMCNDGHDGPASTYTLHVDATSLQITRPR